MPRTRVRNPCAISHTNGRNVVARFARILCDHTSFFSRQALLSSQGKPFIQHSRFDIFVGF
jgi:hypothetical protein